MWLPDAVEAVCIEPDSDVVRLADGRAFRRTRRDINLDNSPSAGLAVGQQSGGAAVISSAVRGYRPDSTNTLLSVLSWYPPGPPARAVNGLVAQSFPVVPVKLEPLKNLAFYWLKMITEFVQHRFNFLFIACRGEHKRVENLDAFEPSSVISTLVQVSCTTADKM